MKTKLMTIGAFTGLSILFYTQMGWLVASLFGFTLMVGMAVMERRYANPERRQRIRTAFAMEGSKDDV
jgi:hypothetical protein